MMLSPVNTGVFLLVVRITYMETLFVYGLFAILGLYLWEVSE